MDVFWENGPNVKILLGVSGILFAIVTFVLSRRAGKLKGIPVMTGYGSDHERAMMEGSLKYPETPFIVETQRPYVIMPPRCFEELKNISQKQASFWGVQRADMLASFTGIFQHNVQLNMALRFDLNRNLAGILDLIEDNITWVLEKELGQPEDWKTVRLHQFIVVLVVRFVAGVFVGPGFLRDDEWTNLAMQLAVDLVRARDSIKRWPLVAQPIVGHFLPETRAVKRQISRMADKLQPVINGCVLEAPDATKRLGDEEKVDLGVEEKWGTGTFMSWLLKRLGTANAEILARAQVSLSFASANTTTGGLMFVVLDLATKPEYTQPLRDEIEEVAREDGVEEDENGVLRFKQSSLAKLWKLDSFINESLRLSRMPITNLRLVTQPIALSTGHKIPPGTRIAFNSRGIQMDPQTHTFSPEYNPPENKPPHEFDGYRFYRLRKIAGREKKHSAVTVGPEALHWGYGVHSCPARFFADTEMKVIAIELLRKWDFRVADPAKTNTDAVRRTCELQIDPPREAEIQLRRRKTVEA